MAIIQGAAFAALFIIIQQDGLFAHGWTLHAWLALGQSLATGLTVVIAPARTGTEWLPSRRQFSRPAAGQPAAVRPGNPCIGPAQPC
jgi:hypothetical protein